MSYLAGFILDRLRTPQLLAQIAYSLLQGGVLLLLMARLISLISFQPQLSIIAGALSGVMTRVICSFGSRKKGAESEDKCLLYNACSSWLFLGNQLDTHPALSCLLLQSALRTSCTLYS